MKGTVVAVKKIIRFEIKRGMNSLGMKVAFLGACIYMIIQNIYPAIYAKILTSGEYARKLGENIYTSGWYPASGDLQGVYYYFYFYGIIVALPFGISYCMDKRSGFVKNICNRIPKGKYLLAKYISVFVTGGIVSALPITLDFLVMRLIEPYDTIDLTAYKCALNSITKWGSFIIDHMYISALLICCVWFVFGGAFATLSLLVSSFTDNLFFVQLFPFFVMMFIYYMPQINTYINSGWIPMTFLRVSSDGSPLHGIIVSFVIAAISFTIFYFRERKRDIL